MEPQHTQPAFSVFSLLLKQNDCFCLHACWHYKNTVTVRLRFVSVYLEADVTLTLEIQILPVHPKHNQIQSRFLNIQQQSRQ